MLTGLLAAILILFLQCRNHTSACATRTAGISLAGCRGWPAARPCGHAGTAVQLMWQPHGCSAAQAKQVPAAQAEQVPAAQAGSRAYGCRRGQHLAATVVPARLVQQARNLPIVLSPPVRFQGRRLSSTLFQLTPDPGRCHSHREGILGIHLAAPSDRPVFGSN